MGTLPARYPPDCRSIVLQRDGKVLHTGYWLCLVESKTKLTNFFPRVSQTTVIWRVYSWSELPSLLLPSQLHFMFCLFGSFSAVNKSNNLSSGVFILGQSSKFTTTFTASLHLSLLLSSDCVRGASMLSPGLSLLLPSDAVYSSPSSIDDSSSSSTSMTSHGSIQVSNLGFCS